MSHPDPLFDPENVLPEDDYDPSEGFQKIMECVSLLQAQAADLDEMLRDFNKSAF